MLVNTIVPVKKIHPITGKEDGVEIIILHLNMPLIKKFTLNEENNNTIINYTDNRTEELLIPFVDFIAFLNRLQILDWTFADDSANYNKNIKKLVTDIRRHNPNPVEQEYK
jgi:hypothetical protein